MVNNDLKAKKESNEGTVILKVKSRYIGIKRSFKGNKGLLKERAVQ